MNGWSGRLIGDAGVFSFEQRIFHFAVLMGVVMTAFGTVMDVYYRVSILGDLFFLMCWLFIYWLSRFKGMYQSVSTVSIGFFALVFFPYFWLSSGGSNGVMPHYGILFIALVSIILSGRTRWVVVGSMLAVEILLLIWDAFGNGVRTITLMTGMHIGDYSLHLLVIMAAMAVLVMVYSNTYMVEKDRKEQYAKALEENYHQQGYYMENLEQLIDRLKSERHDFNHHLGVIYGLLSGGDADEARRYVTGLVDAAQEYQSIVAISYPVLRAMLNYKLSVARERGIALRLSVEVPESLRLNEFDLTVILGNLLDNAMEACAELPEPERYIALRMHYRPEYLVVQMENPVSTQRQELRQSQGTAKPNPEDHGFGLRNIAYLVSKHNGFMEVEPAAGVFRIRVALLAEGISH